MEFRPNYALYCAVVVSIGGFVFGFDASVISGVVGFVTAEFNLTPIQSGLVVAAPTASGLLGTLIAGPLSDHFGRRKILLVIAFIYVCSAAASALSTSFLMLVGARALGGIAFTSLMLAPLYIGEISPAEVRGKRVSINQLNIVLGLSAAYFSNYFILSASESGADWVRAIGMDAEAWRWMLGLEMLPASLFFFMLLTVPDTPRWLMLKGQEERAATVARALLPPEQAAKEVDAMMATSGVAATSVWSRIGELFEPRMRLAIAVGLTVAIAQQITGINAIFFYAPTIFEQSGIGTNAAFSQAVLVGLINVVFTIAAMALIDRWGRKPLLICGLLGIIGSMGLCGWGFANASYQLTEESVTELGTQLNADDRLDVDALAPLIDVRFHSDVAFKSAVKAQLGATAARDYESRLITSSIDMNSTLILVGILGFVASFAISLGPVMWVLFAEIFPTALRGVAVSFVGVVNGGISFLVQLVFPVELEVMGAALTFGLYGGFALIALILVWRLLPETKGLSLERLEQVFGHGTPPR